MESRHKHSIQIQKEDGEGLRGNVVVVADLVITNKINKIKIMQKMQVMVEEEEIKEEGGALEDKLDENKGITFIQMVFGFVARQGTM